MHLLRPVSAIAFAAVLLLGLVVVPLLGAPAPSAGAESPATAAPTWGTATDIPGLASPGSNQNWLTQVACTSPGNCVAGGSYTTGGKVHPLFVDQVNGVWGHYYEVPGSWAFDGDDIDRRVETIACAPEGDCVAAGTYATGRGLRAFVTRRVGGVWTDAAPMPNALEIAGTGDVGQYWLNQSSCSSNANCTVAGYYFSGSATWGGYLVDLTGGVWQNAIDVPGLVAMSTGGLSLVDSVSCPADGECSAAGFYRTSTEMHAFVVDEVHGVWGTATDVPGVAALATAGAASSNAVSCSSDGNCSVVGTYNAHNVADPSVIEIHSFVADRIAGHWNDVQTPQLAGSDDNGISVVSCPSDGNCSAIGRYRVPGDPMPDHDSVFVLERTGGSWGTPVPMPGMEALNTGNGAWVRSISCAAPGTCAATGHFTDGTGKVPFVANSTDGIWNPPIAVPGVHGPSTGDCNYNLFGDTCPTGRSVACASTDSCVVIGDTYPGAVSRGFLAESIPPPEPTTTTTSEPATTTTASVPTTDPVAPVFTG